MNHKPRLYKALRVTFGLVATWLLTTGVAPAQGQNPNQPKIVYGKVLLYMQPGTPRATVDAIAGQIGATKVKFLSLPDCYQLQLPADSATEKATLDAVAKIKLNAKVKSVGGMPSFFKNEVKLEPNDPRYLSGEQWGAKMMNLPQAWAITKGGTGLNVAVIDSGFLPDHEDLINQYVIPGSKNFAEGASDDPNIYDVPINASIPFGTFDGNAHGVHVSGIMVAKTNNGLGVAGVCWENIKCVGMQCSITGDEALDGAAILQSMQYLATNKILLNVGCVNMSFGGFIDPTDTTNPFYIATKSMADAGIICVASAGNSYPYPNTLFSPVGYPFVTSIGSVGPSGQRAYYSQTPKVELAAPGGDQLNQLSDGILSTLPPNENYEPFWLRNVYGFFQGTSMASPNACAVLGLLMSVPGVQPDQALQAMKDTANRGGLATVPDVSYGYGRVDAYKALLSLTVDTRVVDPVGLNENGIPSDLTGTLPQVQTYKPLVRLRINQVTPNNVTITIDGQAATLAPDLTDPTKPTWNLTLPDGTVIPNAIVGDTQLPAPSYLIVFPAKFTPGATPGSTDDRHTIVVSGTNPDSGITRSDTRVFTVVPQTLTGLAVPAADGTVRHLAMISIPYMETAADSPTGTTRDVKELLRPDAVLYRYVYLGSGTNTVPGYASFGSANDQNPDFAKLNFAGSMPSIDGSSDPSKMDIRPIGGAWFAELPDTTVVKTFGREFGDQPIRIPVTEGWNMVGDPYNYPVPFSSVLLEDSKGNRVSIGDAIEQRKVLGLVYRYSGASGYIHDQLPDANLQPWQGHWIYIQPQQRSAVNLANKYYLIVQPTNTNDPGRKAKMHLTRANKATQPSGKPSVAVTGPNSWALQLKAQVGGIRDTYNYIGMTSIAVNEKQLTRVPKPPMPFSYVSVGVTNSETPGVLFAQDMQPIGGVRTWDVVVATDQSDADVNLATNFVGALPRNYRVTLTDKATGQMVDLRNTRSYHYNSGKASPTRSFIITARPTTLGQRAIMSGVFVNPSRSDGRAVPTYEIGYNLSQEANVEVAILSASGRPIATVGTTRAVASGDNRAVWSGRDNAGRTVPAGTYMVQIKAVTTEGEVTRVAHPLLISGR